jgi:hypothetical protein
MARTPSTPWPTAAGSVFFGDGAASPATLSRAVADGRIRRLALGLYSADLAATPEDLVERNLWACVAHFVPDAVVADRSAAANGEPVDGALFVVSTSRARPLTLPGLTVVPRPGSPALDDDPPWAGGLHITSDARTLVDNLVLSRARAGRLARTLSRDEIAGWLVDKAQLRTDGYLDELRAHALDVADRLGVPERREVIEEVIAAAVSPRLVRRTSSRLPAATARSGGRPADADRVRRFGALARYLVEDMPDDVPPLLVPPGDDLAGTLPFFEAYFSNFIEGTEFSLEEAERIVASGQVIPSRPEDAHDMLGTYAMVADPADRVAVPAHAEDMLGLLRRRHRSVMQGRPENRPGDLKQRRNQAGSYVFVEPNLVEGTLVEGFNRLDDLPSGFARAAFQLFVVSEVHPFDDGNGRVARATANAELSAVGQARIVIPISYRSEYQDALRGLSRDGECEPYVRMLAHAWRWTAAMPWHDRSATLGQLAATHALLDPIDAHRLSVRLRLP